MAAKQIRVLLLEDNPGDARLIREMLVETGNTRFELTGADHLAAGLERLAADPFGLVLLDLSLPDSHGLDTFRSLRACAPEVPIVVLTGLDDEGLATQAVQEGAQDYLVKGQIAGRHLAHALRYALGRHQRGQQLEAALRATAEELRIARAIQQNLFPAAAPACPGLDIYGHSFCAGPAGGDYFDYLRMAGDHVGIVIGDVTGHGIGPALLMAATRAYLRAFAQTHTEVGQILALANQVLTEDLDDGRNVTLFLGQLNPRSRSFLYASAGHPPGYVLAFSGTEKARLYSTGLPLGIMADADFAPEPAIRLEPGEVLLLVTDGVVEARDPAGELFGGERTLDVVRANREKSAQEIVQTLYREVRRFSQDRPQQDDISALVIKVGPEP
jgi:serine phosphatase RsbU (regulator of sigma subunit)